MYIAFDNLICAIYGIPSLVIYVSMLFCLLSIRKTLHKSTTFIYLTAAIVVRNLIWHKMKILSAEFCDFLPSVDYNSTARRAMVLLVLWNDERFRNTAVSSTIFNILTIIFRTFQKFLSGYVHYAQDTVTLLMAVDRFYVICNVRHLEVNRIGILKTEKLNFRNGKIWRLFSDLRFSERLLSSMLFCMEAEESIEA